VVKLPFVRINVFGDSIAWGKGDLVRGGWVNRLKIELYRLNRFLEVTNVSVGGDTTKTLLERFEFEARQREPHIVIFAIGINDSQFYRDPDNHPVSLEEYRSNIKDLISAARGLTDKILMIGLSRVDERKTRPIYEITNTHYTNEEIEKYDEVLKNTAEEIGLVYIPVSDLLEIDDLPDGLHVAGSGHEKIAKRVKQVLLASYPDLLYTDV